MKGLRPAVVLAVVAAAVVCAVVVAAPLLPRGTDLYAHVLWSWQVMRCLSAGALPVWLPDLNAGMGSAGIRLYSPLGPVVCGALGLLFGDAGRGIRAAIVLALLILFAVVRRQKVPGWPGIAVVTVASPVVVTEVVTRFPVSEILAIPVAWLLLDIGVRGLHSWRQAGSLLGVLWLLHAPTAAMVGALMAAAAISNRERGRQLPLFLATVATAALLTVWHWLPLLFEASSHTFASALATGKHHPLRNLLGLPDAHLMDINISMGWAAVGVLLALLAAGAWRSRRGALAVAAVALAATPAAPVWRLVPFLAWLQFPWRWLLPASLLAIPALTAARDVAPWRRRLSLVLFAVPILLVPSVRFASDPKLTAHTAWQRAGRAVFEGFDGNPLLVDVEEHRPPWWPELAATLVRLGDRPAVLTDPSGRLRVTAWRPLSREFVVQSDAADRLVVRLLADPHWSAEVDRLPAGTERSGAALSTRLSPGRHTVTVRWRPDNVTLAGVAISAIAIVALGLDTAHRRRARGRSATLSRPPSWTR